MEGQFVITEIEVKNNKMGWGIFDFFRHHLDTITKEPSAGWYAYILENGIYYFLWCDKEDRPSDKYLQALKADSYNVGITPTTIEDAFK